MESRKRPFPDAEDSIVTKKRILTGANGSPQVNGSSENDDNEGFREKLEAYRKEAIYRRMMHYSREHERSVVRIQELERRKTTCEAGLAAISACWSQLVETIRLFVKTDELPEVNLHAKELFDLTAHMQEDSLPELNAALGDTVNATQALVTKFVQLHSERNSSIFQGDAFSEYQKTQNECVLLRSEVNLLRTKLQDSENLKEEYHNALIAAENRLERSQSTIVYEVEGKGKNQEREECMDEKEEARKPSSPAQSSAATPIIHTNGIYDVPHELHILQEQVNARETKIIELEREVMLLNEEKTMLQVESKAPSYEQLSQHSFFKAILDYISYQEVNLTDKADEARRLAEEISQLQIQLAARTDMHSTNKADFEQTIHELSYKLDEKIEENARLRMQRNQAQADVAERKNRDSVKFASLQEYKTLLETNSERINVLQSELRRCKSQIAANCGAEDLLLFLLGGNHDELQFFELMKTEKAELEHRVFALEKTLAGYEGEHPDVFKHMKVETDSLEELSKVNAELNRYRKTFGNFLTFPPDVAQLAEQLQSKEAELAKLRLVVQEFETNQSSLYTELDQLAVQWESLDKQVKNKVFNLNGMEERLLRSVTEKAKAETKFFEAVKAHQAADSERKALQRTHDLQDKAFMATQSVVEKLTNQIQNLEAECTALRKGSACLQERVRELEKENPELKANLELERKRVNEITTTYMERENALQSKRKELRVKEDEFFRYKKDLERQMAQVKREAELQKNYNKPSVVDHELENLRSLLICSTCRGPARSTIITKCMHTFCKGCVDSRLSTRQRKCPACNLPFGASDVHTFFFQ